MKAFTYHARLIYSALLPRQSRTAVPNCAGDCMNEVLMSHISRRTLIASGLALSASSLVSRSAWARAAATLAESSSAAAPLAPREKLLFDFGWRFQFGNGSDPAKDLGFGNDQGDFAKTG